MAKQTPDPKLTSSIRCLVGIPTKDPVRSFAIIPQSDHLLTLEGEHWLTRSLRTGQVNPEIPPSRWSETASMWTERVPSPDGQWYIALNGQTSIEVRNRETMGERQMLNWAKGIPKGYGFWAPHNEFFLISTEEGVTEIWDLSRGYRVTYCPEPVGETSYTSSWPPTVGDGSCTLQLIPTRATWHREGQGVQGEMRPLGRWPVAGGGLAFDLRSAVVVTGLRPDRPEPDSWIGGEVIVYDLASSRPSAASAHGIQTGGGPRVLANPTLSHLFVNTPEGALFCVEAATGRTVYSIGYQPGCTAAIFTPDGRRCVAGLEDGEVQMLGDQADQVLWHRRAHEFGISNVGLSPDGARAVTVGADRSLVCWDAASGNPIAGAPPRYDRAKDPLQFLLNPQGARPEAEKRLGPAVGSIVVAGDTFTLDYSGHLYRFPYSNLSQSTGIWKGPSVPGPDGEGYIVYEILEAEKKKVPKLGVFRLDPRTGERSLLASVDAPPDAKSYPLFVNAKRCLLPRKEGGLMLLRLDKKLFHHDIPLDTGTIRVTGMGFYVSADGSAFGLSHGAELRLYRSDDGKLLADFVLEVPRRENEPAVVGCWLGSQGKEIAVMLQSGTLQRWSLQE